MKPERKKRLLNNDLFLGYLFLLPTFICLGCLILFPVLQTIKQSFFDTNYITGNNNFIGLGNYLDVLQDGVFLKALKIDVIWTLGSVAFQMLLGLLTALLISKDTRMNTIIRSILLTPYVIPIISLVLLFQWMLNDTYGILTNFFVNIGVLEQGGSLLASPVTALPTVIAVNVLRSFPFCMVNYLGGIQAISQDQFEAAMIDGANSWQKFRYITLPSLKPITYSLLVLRMIWEFNAFDMIYLMTAGGPAQSTQHLPILIYTEAVGMFNFGRASAMSILMGIILIVMIVLFSRISKGKEKGR